MLMPPKRFESHDKKPSPESAPVMSSTPVLKLGSIWYGSSEGLLESNVLLRAKNDFRKMTRNKRTTIAKIHFALLVIVLEIVFISTPKNRKMSIPKKRNTKIIVNQFIA